MFIRICLASSKYLISLMHGHRLLKTRSRVEWGADKSLARPGRKQARKHVRDERDFNNIETRAVVKFFFLPLQDTAPKEIHVILTET